MSKNCYQEVSQPTRCVDPVMKFCQECQYGQCIYPDGVETYADLEGCTFDTVCILGFDKGRPEDNPTEEEIKEFDDWCKQVYKRKPCLPEEV